MKVICAWCGKVLRDGSASSDVSHGLCAGCAEETGILPVENFGGLSAEQLDALPFGVIEVDRAGVVRQYNAAEQHLSGLHAESVVGRNFFTEIAPCTRVREFEGEFKEVVAGDKQHASLTFVFRFGTGDVVVNVGMSYDAQRDSGSILVRKVG